MGNQLHSFVMLCLRSQYKKPKIIGLDNFIEGTPALFMSNHARFYGPIIMKTRFTIPVRLWAISKMIEPARFNPFG